MRRRNLFTAALAVVVVAVGSASAGASLLVSIVNTVSSGAIAATLVNPPGLVVSPSSEIAPFLCTNGTLTGTIPSSGPFPAPLGTPRLPIGTFTGGAVGGCPTTSFVTINPVTGPSGIALNAVLLTNGSGATGALITILDFSIQVVGPGERCIYRGPLSGLFDEATQRLNLLSGTSLQYSFGSCSAGLYVQLTGSFALPGISIA